MGRKTGRRRRYGRLPLSARIPLAATLIPLAMAAGCIGGFLRLRPVITGSMTATALAVGFLAAVATIVPLSGGDGPDGARAADVETILTAAAPLAIGRAHG